MAIQSYKLELSHGEKTISFGPRRLGDVGNDIAAVKLALGSVVRAQDLPGENGPETLSDPNGWFDCVDGVESTPIEVATFNKNLQSRLMKFQLDNQFFIINYLFRKYGVAKMINDINVFEEGERYKDLTKASKKARKESISLQVIESVISLFDAEFGELGEATLSVLHGWRPQTVLSNKSYYTQTDSNIPSNQLLIGARPLSENIQNEPNVILDVIPSDLFDQFVNGQLSQKSNSEISMESIIMPIISEPNANSLNLLKNKSTHFEYFKQKAPDNYQWIPDASMGFGSIIYRPRPKILENGVDRTSILYSAAVLAMESMEEITRTIDLQETQTHIERALQPNPFTDPDPFIISRSRIGFFDITDFTFENLFNEDPETIKELEDKALSKVLKFYSKPDIWYHREDDIEFLDQYFVVGGENPKPEHDLKLPDTLADDADKKKYWVLTTRENLRKSSLITEESVQYHDEIEGENNNEPLIKFIEYRTPQDFRPGAQYRAEFEINSEKLDLIIEGYKILYEPLALPAVAQTPAEDNEDVANTLANQIAVECEDFTEEENRRRFKEYRTFAVRNRREIVRRFREAALTATQEGTDVAAERRTRMNLDLGPLGTYQTDKIGSWGVELSQWVVDYAQGTASGLGPGGQYFDAADVDATGGDYNLKITLGFSELEERIKIAKEDLIEAQKQATEEKYVFAPKEFNAATEAENLSKILARIKIYIEQGDPNFGFSDRTSLSDFLGGTGPLIPNSDKITIYFTVNLGDGPSDLSGAIGLQIKKIVTNKTVYGGAGSSEPPSEFLKPIAMGYLSQISEMTGNPGHRSLRIVRQVAPGSPGCSDAFSPKNGIAYLRQYTKFLGITPPGKREEDKFVHKAAEWGERTVTDPATAWSKESLNNAIGSFVDTSKDFWIKDLAPKFGQDEILSGLGDTCSPHLLRNELFNKLSLPGLLCDYLKCAKLPGFDIQIPDFNFPSIPDLPIFGFYTNFADFILKKFQEIVIRILCTFLRTLLEFLEFPFCAEQFKDAFGNSAEYSPLVKEALSDALFNLQLSKEDLAPAQDFIDSAFRHLRGDEICRLLSGETLDPAAMAMLQRLAEANGLNTRFSNREDLEEFFSIIAGFVPSTFCDVLENVNDIAGAATCQNTTEALEEMRRRMLAGENVTDDEIRAAMELAEKNLMDAFEAQVALSENGLIPLAGQYMAMGDKDALINSYPDSLNDSISRTSQNVFEKAKSSYINSLGSFIPRLSTEVPSIAKPGDPNYDPIAVLKYEAALENLRRFAALHAGDDAAPEPDEQFESLYGVYDQKELDISGKKVAVHKRLVGNNEISLLELENLNPDPDTVSLKIKGYGKNLIFSEVTIEDASGETYKSCDAYKAFNAPGGIHLEGTELVSSETDAQIKARKQNLITERLLELNTVMERELPKVYAPQTKSEYMAYIKEIYDIALEDTREESPTYSEDPVEMIGTDSENHKVLKMKLTADNWTPELSFQEFPTFPQKNSFTITVKDSHLFPNSPASGENFEYCESVPEEYIDLQTTPAQTIAKRSAFAQHYISKLRSTFSRYDLEDIMSGTQNIYNIGVVHSLLYGDNANPTEKSLYVKSFEGIMEQLFYSLRNARIFDEEYGQQVGDRIRGRYIEENCIRNRFNLNHYGILSFDKMVTDEIPDLVSIEMARPENQPQNLDYSKPGPIEKAIQIAALKGFIRICLIELMLKGSVPYSVWDVEGVISDQFYQDYVARYIFNEIEKTESFKGIWRETAEKIANVSGGEAAIKKIVSTEIWLLPDLSRRIYDNKKASYENWFMDQVPNVDVSSELAPESVTLGGRRIWNTALGDQIYNDPFLSIEHYLRVDGPLADFANLSYDTGLAFQDFLGEMGSVTNEETGLNFSETSQQYNVFNNIVSELSGISTESESLGFDLSFLDGTGTEGDPAIQDPWPQTEVYSIGDVQNIFEQINSLSKVFDEAIQPKFGFISAQYITESGRLLSRRAHLMAEVIKRTPARMIKRQRQSVTLDDENVFTHLHSEMQKVFDKDAPGVSLGSSTFIKSEIESLMRDNKIVSDPGRYYIIPGNGEKMMEYTHSPDRGSVMDAQSATLMENIFNPLYNVGNPTNTEGIPNRGYKMLGLNWNGEETEYTPLHPDAPWLDDTGIINDKVSSTSEVFYQNIYGQVDEELFNEIQQEISSHSGGDFAEDAERNIPYVERWVETVFEFKEKASVVFGTPGESGDPVITRWPEFGLTKARDSFKRLLAYIKTETGDDGQSGTYVNQIMFPHVEPAYPGDSSNTIDPRTLVLGVKTSNLDGANPNEPQEVLQVGPGHPMCDNWTWKAGLDQRTIFKKLTDFGVAQRGNRVEYEIGDLMEALDTSLFYGNQYFVPVRLIVTQIIDDRDGTVKEVFSRVVLPEVLDFSKSHEYRAKKLDEALSRIIEEYIDMVEDAYTVINPDNSNWRYNVSQNPNETSPSSPVALELKYKRVMENFSTFPYFLRQHNLMKRDADRSSFCSVSKIYSYACKIEAERREGNFFNSQQMKKMDGLFADPGYLMKNMPFNDPQTALGFYEESSFYNENPASAALALPLLEEAISNITYLLHGPDGIPNSGDWNRDRAIAWFRENPFTFNPVLFGYLPVEFEGELFREEVIALYEAYEEDLSIFVNNAGLAGRTTFVPGVETNEYDGQLGVWHIIWRFFRLAKVHIEGIADHPAYTADSTKNYFDAVFAELNEERGTKLEKYLKSFSTQQKLGLNFLYQSGLDLSRIEDIAETQTRSNKVALSIANIFHWFSERRVESFWGRTTREEWLAKSLDFDPLVRSITDLARSAHGRSGLGAEAGVEFDPEHEVQTGATEAHDLQYLQGQGKERFRITWSNAGEIDTDFYFASVETPDVLCGFSPFLGDDRYHFEELVESFKEIFIQVSEASLDQTLDRFLIGYNELIGLAKTQTAVFESVSSAHPVGIVGSAGVHRVLSSTPLIPYIDSLDYILNGLSVLIGGDTPLEALPDYITSKNLPITPGVGFPGMTRDQKIYTLFSKDAFESLTEKLRSESLRFQVPANLYRFGFGLTHTILIQHHVRTFIRKAIQYQHDSWICMLKNTGMWYFYEMFQNIFLNALQEQVGRTFSGSTIHHCSRLMHNTPREDAAALFDILSADTNAQVYGHISNEERAYKTYISNEGTYLYSQPLASFEEVLNLENFSVGRLVSTFDDNREYRKQQLIQTEDAKLVLDFIFPIKKYMAMSTVFSTSVLGGYGEIPKLLVGAKSSLAMVFLICSLSPKAKLNFLSDLSQSEFMKMAIQSATSDGTSMDCFDFPFNLDLLNQFIEELKEMIKQMASIVLRGIANQIDPAYKEMKHHWAACDIKNLRNSDLKFLTADSDEKLVSGLDNKSRRDRGEYGKYVPIFPAAAADLGYSLYLLAPSFTNPWGWKAMANTLSRMLAYGIRGPGAMIDLSFAFKIPCMEVDENWGPKWNIGSRGRYGQPMTPITALALSTAEINGERELRNKNCADILRDPDDSEACDDV